MGCLIGLISISWGDLLETTCSEMSFSVPFLPGSFWWIGAFESLMRFFQWILERKVLNWGKIELIRFTILNYFEVAIMFLENHKSRKE